MSIRDKISLFYHILADYIIQTKTNNTPSRSRFSAAVMYIPQSSSCKICKLYVCRLSRLIDVAKITGVYEEIQTTG